MKSKNKNLGIVRLYKWAWNVRKWWWTLDSLFIKSDL